MNSEITMPIGTEYWGFWATLPLVTMLSKPTKAWKQVAAPQKIPWKPKRHESSRAQRAQTRGDIESSLHVVLFCELSVAQISLNDARDDDKTEKENFNQCEPFGNLGKPKIPQTPEFNEEEHKTHNKEA